MPASMTRLFVHYVWGTWQREPWLIGDVRETAFRIISTKCRDDEAQVLALNGIEDHIHLLVKISPIISIAKLIADIKGASSFILNRQKEGEIFKWQEGYGAFTVSQSGIQKTCDYIANQQVHHSSQICRAITMLDSVS
jgi:putative transposase